MAVSLLLALGVGLLPAASMWMVERDGAEHPVQSRELGGVTYLSAADLAAAFGGWIKKDGARGNYQFEIAGTRMILSAREGLASIGGRLVTLPHANRVISGDLWIVPEFVEKAISPVYPRTVERDGTRYRVRGVVPIEVSLRTSRDPRGTRCVLEFSREVRYRVASGPGGVTVQVLEGPLRTDRIGTRIAGDEVESVKFEPSRGGVGGTFAFAAGTTFHRVRDSRMKDPFRVILDFDREPETAAGGTLAPILSDMAPERGRGIHRIVIDPGHGGAEVGAEGPTGLYEKEVVLDVAQRLAARLRREPSVEVVLTRDTDKAIPLDDRAGIANHHDGDLFISIHANASRGSRASGAETYFLSQDASDAQANQLAEAENEAGGAVAAASKAGDGLETLLWDMAQQEHQRESFLLAETIQRDMNALLGTRDRGVRQAPFRVLMGVRMPAVLVEVAFISNPEEEAQLKTSPFRERIAEALAASIARYKRQYEARSGVAGADSESSRGGS